MFPWKCLTNWALMEMSFCTFKKKKKKRKAKIFFLWSWAFYLYAPVVHSPWSFPPNSRLVCLVFLLKMSLQGFLSWITGHLTLIDCPSAELKAKLKWVKSETIKFTSKKNILGSLAICSCRQFVCVWDSRADLTHKQGPWHETTQCSPQDRFKKMWPIF